MIFVIGLAMIIAGWVVQLYKTIINNVRELSPTFLVLYAIGVALLASGNFMGNDIRTGILNTISLAVSAVLLIAIIIHKRRA